MMIGDNTRWTWFKRYDRPIMEVEPTAQYPQGLESVYKKDFANSQSQRCVRALQDPSLRISSGDKTGLAIKGASAKSQTLPGTYQTIYGGSFIASNRSLSESAVSR